MSRHCVSRTVVIHQTTSRFFYTNKLVFREIYVLLCYRTLCLSYVFQYSIFIGFDAVSVMLTIKYIRMDLSIYINVLLIKCSVVSNNTHNHVYSTSIIISFIQFQTITDIICKYLRFIIGVHPF